MRPNGSGTGLWLTLAKHILEKLHGFTLSIASTVGKGTRVSIVKPILERSKLSCWKVFQELEWPK
jgi:signal transduction histidine kinase